MKTVSLPAISQQTLNDKAFEAVPYDCHSVMVDDRISGILSG